jgi:hypothetical protein
MTVFLIQAKPQNLCGEVRKDAWPKSFGYKGYFGTEVSELYRNPMERQGSILFGL